MAERHNALAEAMNEANAKVEGDSLHHAFFVLDRLEEQGWDLVKLEDARRLYQPQ